MTHRFFSLPPARAVVLALAALISTGCSKPPAALTPIRPEFVIKLEHDENGRDLFLLEGLNQERLQGLAAEMSSPDRWRSWFAVRIAGNNGPPMLGDYSISRDKVCFRPRFPLDPGKSYVVTVGGDQQICSHVFDVPAKTLPPLAGVSAIYPSGDKLPENLLRIYLQFTGPMRRGDVYEFIRLLGPDGKPVETPFVTFGEELWNGDCTRLTLLLDPGRQKHDLLPRQQSGPVLESGKQYTLIISGDWPDAYGRPLGHDYRKEFTAVAAESRPVQPAEWKLSTPTAGAQEPLTVKFDRPLDHELLKRMLTITDAAGKPIDGDIKILDNETDWQFIPKEAWLVGTYSLSVDPILEDVSGNRVGRAFEVDEDRTEPISPRAERIVFAVKAK